MMNIIEVGVLEAQGPNKGEKMIQTMEKEEKQDVDNDVFLFQYEEQLYMQFIQGDLEGLVVWFDIKGINEETNELIIDYAATRNKHTLVRNENKVKNKLRKNVARIIDQSLQIKGGEEDNEERET